MAVGYGADRQKVPGNFGISRGYYGVVVKWAALVVVELPPIKTV
jgi:hypothetical protein